MNDLKESFALLIGRQATDREIERLHRIKGALGIRDNDALWSVLLALESYDALYREYPAAIAKETQRILEVVRAESKTIAQAEMARVMTSLADQVKGTSTNASDQSVQADRMLVWGWGFVGALLLAAISMLVGAVLASGAWPGWAGDAAKLPLIVGVAATIARAPAGLFCAAWALTVGCMALWPRRAAIKEGKHIGLVAGVAALGVLSAVMVALLFVH